MHIIAALQKHKVNKEKEQEIIAATFEGFLAEMKPTGKEEMTHLASDDVVTSSKSAKWKPPQNENDDGGCKSETLYTWNRDNSIVIRSMKRVPDIDNDPALLNKKEIQTYKDNPILSVLESYFAFKALEERRWKLKAEHPKTAEESALEKGLKVERNIQLDGWEYFDNQPKHMLHYLHDGLGVAAFDELASNNVPNDYDCKTILQEVCPTVSNLFYGESAKGILLPMSVNPSTFSYNGWYSSISGQDENRHQMTNNMAWHSDYHQNALPEVETAHKYHLEKYGGDEHLTTKADSRPLRHQSMDNKQRVVTSFDIQRRIREG